MASADQAPSHSSWGALRHRGFFLYWLSRLLASFATQVISVAVGWQVYDLTRNPLDLGLVGLFQFLPALTLVLVTGAAADRFNRRMIVAVCQVGEGLCAGALLAFTLAGSGAVGIIFALLVAFGIARAFYNPASQSLIPNLVPPADLASAIAMTTTSWQISIIVGPVAGGLLYGVAPEAAYGAALAMLFAAAVLIVFVERPEQKTVPEPPTWKSLMAGIRYVWEEKIVFGAISLDLFAVLLGGATALLPAYARDILEVGPWGLGMLRSATGVGAILMAVYLTLRPVRDRAGFIMFVGVGLFGAFTIVFGLSAAVWLSVLALAAMGAADMISVYVRETLIQTWTPDAVRGRVNAVNMVFIGASNELGEFRAGTVAAVIGVVPAVVVGGIGTIAVATLWSRWFPALRRIRRLDGER